MTDTNTLLHDATVDVVQRAARDLSSEHDSDKCNCDQCRWANEQRQQAQTIVSDVDRYAQLRPQPWADAATVRAAVMDVIDSGDEDERQWFLYERISTVPLSNWNEDAANEERSKFADAVLARVAQLQQPPHVYPQMRQLCDSHKRRRLPTYSGECVDCKRERS